MLLQRAPTVRDKLWMFGVPAGADNRYVKRWSNGTMWSSISPVEGTLYMGMSNMMYVYQNAGFSQSQQPGQRQNGDGFTTCPLDPRNRLNASSGVASEEHVWAARSLATMPGSVRPPILPHSQPPPAAAQPVDSRGG